MFDDIEYNLPPHEEQLYDIVQFRFNETNEVIKEGVTLEEAQEHCNSEDSHGEGWFDGYRKVAED